MTNTDPEIIRELLISSTGIILIVVVGGFLAFRAFINWEKRDRAQRERDAEKINR